MARKTVGQRVDRLEQVVQLIAEEHLHLEKVVAELATETRKAFDQVAKQSAKRGRETDERIEKLVIAMGEFIRRENQRK